MNNTLHIIGAGLAGSEAAWQAAHMGIAVVLHEMRPTRMTPAHKTQGCAELVCSNSFRSDDHEHNAVGLIHHEMRQLDSLIMREGDKAGVPAGGALAVDRDVFSQGVTEALEAHPNITIERDEISDIPADWQHVIIATGPLTSDPLAQTIATLTGEDELAFFDAIAPIIHTDSINMDIAWRQSRYDKAGPDGTGKDYINCPMDKTQYEAFIDALLSAEYGVFKDWELPDNCTAIDEDTPYFDGCMPVEIMAERGIETLRFGPMKPVGLIDPRTGEEPYAVVQLRQDNQLGTLYNMVGFQTKMKWGDQTRVFKTIPGLEDAVFARLGGLHRNTFINAPKLLNETLQLKTEPRIRFAGQITGCEGYVESAAIGMLAGRFAAAQIFGQSAQIPPTETALGALLGHITGGADASTYQPMNINFGLFPPLSRKEATVEYTNKKGKIKRAKRRGQDRKRAYTDRAKTAFEGWIDTSAKAA